MTVMCYGDGVKVKEESLAKWMGKLIPETGRYANRNERSVIFKEKKVRGGQVTVTGNEERVLLGG